MVKLMDFSLEFMGISWGYHGDITITRYGFSRLFFVIIAVAKKSLKPCSSIGRMIDLNGGFSS